MIHAISKPYVLIVETRKEDSKFEFWREVLKPKDLT